MTSWPLPSHDPQTVGGVVVPQMPAALLDAYREGHSEDTRDHQEFFRTWRAGLMAFAPERNRIYAARGSAVFAFDSRTYFARLARRETPVSAEQYPIPCQRQGHPEFFLRPDAYAYPELADSLLTSIGVAGWHTPRRDSQDRLSAFDFDDRGYVYTAHADDFNWCVWFDDGSDVGALMAPIHQEWPVIPGFEPSSITCLKSSAGRYYIIIPGLSTSAVFDVTDPANPVPRTDLRTAVGNVSKLRDGRMAFIGVLGLAITSADDLIAGEPVRLAYGAISDRAVATDGTNLFVVGYRAGNAILKVLSPSGDGFAVSPEKSIGQAQPAYISVGGGFLAIGFFGDTKLFSVSQSLTVTEIPLNGFLGAFYGMALNPSPVHAPSLGPCYPVQIGTNVYLVVPAGSVGDAYLLAGDVPIDPVKPTPCPTMTTANLQINGPNGSPANGQIFFVNDSIAFSVGGSYPFSCNAKHSFTWTLGSTSQTTATSFASHGTYAVTCLVTRDDGATLPLSASVIIIDKPIETGCPKMDANNVFVAMSGSGQPQPVNVGDAIPFSVERFPPYPAEFSCAPHTFTWSTNAGALISNPSARATAMTFPKSGTFVVQCTVDNKAQRFTAQMPVTVTGGSQPVPTISGYEPANAHAGDPALTLIVHGANFTVIDQIAVNGKFRGSIVLDSTRISCLLVAADLASVVELVIGVGHVEGSKYVGADSRPEHGGIGNFKVLPKSDTSLTDAIAKVEADMATLSASLAVLRAKLP